MSPLSSWSDTLRRFLSTAEVHSQRCHCFQIWAACSEIPTDCQTHWGVNKIVPFHFHLSLSPFTFPGWQVHSWPAYSWPSYQRQCSTGEETLEANGKILTDIIADGQNIKISKDVVARCVTPATCTATSRWVGKCSSTLPTTCFMQGKQRNKDIDNINIARIANAVPVTLYSRVTM